MTKYHIMYFFDYGKSFGGAVNALMQQAVLMKRAGHKTTIVISALYNKISQEYQDICTVNEIEYIQLDYPIASNPESIDILPIISGYDGVKSKIEELRPDILHSVQINPIVELAGRELRIPHIMNIYQMMPDFFSIPYSDIFPHYHICDSIYFAERWHSYLKTDSACIRTVVNYSNKKDGRRLTEKKPIDFACVGAICERKNQLNVIKAFHFALQRGVDGVLRLYGYEVGEYGNQCKDYVKKNKLEEKIIFEGFCSDMSIEYKKNDVLICGSTMESYPNVISEALANGVMVISTPVAGVPEVIKDGYNGFLCRNYESEAICEKIEQFERERKNNQVDRILTNAYDTYQRYHSPEVVTKELLSYYQHVLEDLRDKANVGINEIKTEFKDTIDFYNEKYNLFTKPGSVRLKLWYIYHIKDIVNNLIRESKAGFYVWGTGNYSVVVKEILEVFFPDLSLNGFIDTYKEGEFCDLKVFSPDSVLSDKRNIIFVGIVNGQEEVLQVLKSYGKECNKDYFIMVPRRW